MACCHAASLLRFAPGRPAPRAVGATAKVGLPYAGFVDVSEMQAYCLGKPGAWPDNPWGHEHPVIKVQEKIFAFLGAGGVGVKSGPTGTWPTSGCSASRRMPR